MTSQQLYRECERLFRQTDWSNKESVNRYNEAVRKLHEQRNLEEKKVAQK